jgi:hypothetical protein
VFGALNTREMAINTRPVSSKEGQIYSSAAHSSPLHYQSSEYVTARARGAAPQDKAWWQIYDPYDPVSKVSFFVFAGIIVVVICTGLWVKSAPTVITQPRPTSTTPSGVTFTPGDKPWPQPLLDYDRCRRGNEVDVCLTGYTVWSTCSSVKATHFTEKVELAITNGCDGKIMVGYDILAPMNGPNNSMWLHHFETYDLYIWPDDTTENVTIPLKEKTPFFGPRQEWSAKERMRFRVLKAATAD